MALQAVAIELQLV